MPHSAGRDGTRGSLTEFLKDFVRTRQGLRTGVMFGMPAVYAGRRLVACVSGGGLVCRLTKDDVRGRAVTIGPFVVNGRESKGWSIVRPGRLGFHHLAPLLERAAVKAVTAPPRRRRQPRGVR